MKTQYKKVIDLLLKGACPSIQYRIRTEILGEARNSASCKALQRAIQKDPLVQEAFTYRSPDGSDIDQRRSLNTAARIFYEKGLDPSYRPLNEIVAALDYSRCGRTMQGRRAMKATGDRSAHMMSIWRSYFRVRETEEDKLVQLRSASLFKDVANLDSLEDVISHNKSGGVFKKEFLWPDLYDLDVVGLGHAWRSDEYQGIMVRALRKIIELFPQPGDIRGKYYWPDKKTWSNYSIAYVRISPSLPHAPSHWNRGWFKVFELLSRMPFVLAVEAIEGIAVQLDEKLTENDGWFTEDVHAGSWNFWSCYSGLALEESSFHEAPYDWVSEEGRMYDTTFRCLLILHGFGML